jgi:two-component system nitrate/nitrite response regulator NarL
MKKTVGICDSQPATAEGVRSALTNGSALACGWTTGSLAIAEELQRQSPADVLLIDKSFGIQAVLDTLATFSALEHPAHAIVWGISITESEALRLLQAGARGILRKSADLPTVLACLAAVAGGQTWMDDCVLRATGQSRRPVPSELTPREQQVLELVEQGMKNREIARELGIRPGTVKIHLRHIFEKTGVHGRYGLALNGLKQRPAAGLARVQQSAL